MKTSQNLVYFCPHIDCIYLSACALANQNKLVQKQQNESTFMNFGHLKTGSLKDKYVDTDW